MTGPSIPPPPNYPPTVPVAPVRPPQAPGPVTPPALVIPPPSRTPAAPTVTPEQLTKRSTVPGGLIPDWRKGPTANLTPPAENSNDDRQEDQEGQEDEEETETAHPAPAAAPAAAPAPPVDQPIQTDPNTSPGQSRIRPILFTGTAAAAGYYAGVVDAMGKFLPGAEHAATGTIGLGLAIVGATTTWRITGAFGIARLLPAATVSRVIVAVIGAELGRRLAPVPVAWINQYGTTAGFGPGQVSLTLTAAGLCGALYWGIDRHARTWWIGTRWVARIPLASALLATALYAPGIHH